MLALEQICESNILPSLSKKKSYNYGLFTLTTFQKRFNFKWQLVEPQYKVLANN